MIEKTKNQYGVRYGLFTALAVFSLLTVLTNTIGQPLHEAYALTITQLSTNTTPQMIRSTYYNGQSFYVSVGNNGVNEYVSIINATTGKNINDYNITASVGGQNRILEGVSCSTNTALCVIGYRWQNGNNGLTVDRIILADIRHGWFSSQAGGYNYTQKNVDSVIYSPNLSGIGAGDSVYVMNRNNGAGNLFIDALGIPSVPANNQTAFQVNKLVLGGHTSTGATSDIVDSELGYFNSSGVTFQYIAYAIGGQFTVWSFASNSQQCSVTPSGFTSGQDIQYMFDTTTGTPAWLYADASVNRFVVINNSCTVTTTGDIGTITPTTSIIKGLSYSSPRHEIYVQTGGASTSRLLVINDTSMPASLTTSQVLGTYPLSADGTGASINRVVNEWYSSIGIAIVQNQATNLRLIYWIAPGASSSGGGSSSSNTCGSSNIPPHCVGDVNCDLPANAGLLMCVNALTSTGSLTTSGGSFSFNPVNATGNLITSALGIGNSNIKTNGVGYFMCIAAVILLNILWYSSLHILGQRGIVVQQPMFISFVITMGVIIAFVLAGWTDPLMLILGVVGIVAFASPKIVGIIRGGGETVAQ